MPSPNNLHYNTLNVRTLNANARTRRLRELNHRRHLNELAKAGYTYSTNTNKIPRRRSIISPLAKSRSTMKKRPTNPISSAKTRAELLKSIYNDNRRRYTLNGLNALNTSSMTPRQLRELLAKINY